jgi:twitching motility protein PilT
MAKIDAFFKLMHEQKASDLHLTSGSAPVLRIHGDLQRIKYKVLGDDELKAMLYEIAPEHKIKKFEETGDVDFAYEIPTLARYRVNFYSQMNGVGAAFREIPSKISTPEELGLPPVIPKLALLPRGMVLVTGPTGSGKSTTLASMINYANTLRQDHVITIEDPIEFVHHNKGCLINQREVGTHTQSFHAALRGSLREDPDIILVGEMRDLETISLAIEATLTGHLVMATLHTISAVKTVDRIIDIFPTSQQAQVRASFSDAVRAVISQTMFKRYDVPGRCVAFEVLIATPAVRNLIREIKTHQILSVMQTGKQYGMQTLDDAIMDLLQRGWIDPDEAYNKCIEKNRFKAFARTAPTDFTEV